MTLGYFSHKFEELGFDCYSVESDRNLVYFLKKVKRAENRKFNVISKSIFEFRDGEVLDFDVVLALNIFHHFLKKKKTYEKFIELLQRIKTKELFFQAHNCHEDQMKGAYKNYSPESFVDFLLRYCQLTKSKFIGKTENGRSIYKLHD